MRSLGIAASSLPRDEVVDSVSAQRVQAQAAETANHSPTAAMPIEGEDVDYFVDVERGHHGSDAQQGVPDRTR